DHTFAPVGRPTGNAVAERFIRTMKYRPGYPRKPFDSIEAARGWVEDFVAWYNGEHLHSGIRYVTPNDRHAGRDVAILAKVTDQPRRDDDALGPDHRRRVAVVSRARP
ncbi:MAG: integrase core domain-containing protein, partial [Deltaproteobacteria bacterium]